MLLIYFVVVPSEDETKIGMIPSLEYKFKTETKTILANERKDSIRIKAKSKTKP